MSAPLTVKLRYYQKDAADAFEKYLGEYKKGNGVIVLPTAAGKSYTLAELIRRFAGGFGARILVVSHTQNIVQQDYDSTCKLWPAGKDFFGINSDGLGSRDTESQVLFCGIQSVFKSVEAIGKVNLLIVDECHRINLQTSVQYKQFIKDLYDLNPKMRVCGLSATPFRMTSGLVYGPSSDLLFDDLVYEADTKELMYEGFLARPISPPVKKENRINTEGLPISSGPNKDFIEYELYNRVNDPSQIDGQTSEVLEGSYGVKSIAVFAVNIKHAELIAKSYRRHGENSIAVIHSKNKGNHKELIKDYKSLKIRVLISVNMFVEGFDAPNIQVIDDRKPTKSPGRYVQMYGRGFRICIELNKTTFTVFDFAGNVGEHGPVDQVKAGERDTEKVNATKKQCEQCGAMVKVALRECPYCGWIFPKKFAPEPEDNTSSEAGNLDIISKPKWFEVTDLKCSPSKKKALLEPAIVAHYYCGTKKFTKDVTFDREGRAWLRKHLGSDVPLNVHHFFKGGFRSKMTRPKEILVDVAGSSSIIMEYRF